METIGYDGISVLEPEKIEYLVSHLRTIKDFPSPGINFRDIMGVLADAKAFTYLIDAMVLNSPSDVDVVAGTDSRGFLLAAPLALRLGVGFVPLRKGGKLPPPVWNEAYQYEYATGSLELKMGDVKSGQNILVVDDLIATGGTIGAARKLIERTGANILKFLFFIELTGLDGKKFLNDYDYTAMISLPA
jgi:adenine phosphoribosyltransferase